jgi:hypothetical protein
MNPLSVEQWQRVVITLTTIGLLVTWGAVHLLSQEIERLNGVANTAFNNGLTEGARRAASKKQPCNTKEWLQEGKVWKTTNGTIGYGKE